MPDFELFQLYLHHVTPNSFLFFVEKTRFAFCFVYSLNATSPGPLLKNLILVLVHGPPVLMLHPHSWCPRITKIGDGRTHKLFWHVPTQEPLRGNNILRNTVLGIFDMPIIPPRQSNRSKTNLQFWDEILLRFRLWDEIFGPTHHQCFF